MEMTERTSTIILIVGAVVVFLAAYVGLSATVVMRGWLPGLTMPDLSRLSMPEVGTTRLTAAGLSVGVLAVVAGFVLFGRVILGPPRRSHQPRAAAVSRRRPAKSPVRTTRSRPTPAPAGADRVTTLSLPPVPPASPCGRYTAGRAPVPPGRGPASTSEFPAACLRGARGRVEVAASRPRGAVEAVTSPMPRLAGDVPPAGQPGSAAGGGRGVARGWAAAGRQNLQTLRAPGASIAQGSNGTTTAKGAGSDAR